MAHEILLYHCPGACSQVTVCALAMAELPYKLELVNLPQGEQLSADYLAISSLGKVPYAVIDGQGMGENAAILIYIAELCPEAGIFPVVKTPRDRAEIFGALSYCGGTLHPIVRGLFNPKRMTTGDPEGVREMSLALSRKNFKYVDARLADHGWWLGHPSIIDVYINWVVSVGRKARFDFSTFPQLNDLASKLTKTMPAYSAMLAKEEESMAKLGL